MSFFSVFGVGNLLANKVIMNEKQIAIQAKNKLYNAVQQNISRQFTSSDSANSMRYKTQVKTRFNKSQLVRLSVTGPKHLYVQNYGFEGVKSNGVNMRLQQTNVVNSAIEQSNVVEFLAQELSEFRANEIVIKMRG